MAVMVDVGDTFICEATITIGRCFTFASNVMFLLVTEATEGQAEAQEQMVKTVTSMCLAEQLSMMLRQVNTSVT